MNLLKKIIQERRRRWETEDVAEQFPYVIWWTCLVDLNALLSGIGSGEVVLSLIHSNRVPTGAEIREAPLFLDTPVLSDRDRNFLTGAWLLQREIGIAAARIGEIALQIRSAYFQTLHQGSIQSPQLHEMQGHADHAMELLQSTWESTLHPHLTKAIEENTLCEEGVACFAGVGTRAICLRAMHSFKFELC